MGMSPEGTWLEDLTLADVFAGGLYSKIDCPGWQVGTVEDRTNSRFRGGHPGSSSDVCDCPEVV